MEINDRLLAIDQHGTLAITPEIWFATLILCRYLILGFMSMISMVVGQGSQTLLVIDSLNYWYFLAEVPALIFLVACFYRGPKASLLMANIWSAGYVLIPLAAASHLALDGLTILASPFYLDKATGVRIAFILVEVLIIYYFLLNKYIRMVLAEHPANRQTIVDR